METTNNELIYEGLIPGKEYTVQETLIDSNGNEITRSTTFTPEESGGEINLSE